MRKCKVTLINNQKRKFLYNCIQIQMITVNNSLKMKLKKPTMILNKNQEVLKTQNLKTLNSNQIKMVTYTNLNKNNKKI